MNMRQFASIMNDSINASRLPIPEPAIFTGNSLEYPSWKCSFETLIETKRIHANHRLHYLKKYLGGEAKTAVECTFFVNSNQHTAFLNAEEMLEKRYGNPSLISEATSSPGCANFALKSLANSSRNAYSNDIIDFLLNSFYVDDELYRTKTVEDACIVVNESTTLCSSRNLRLHKFVSNNRNLLNKIPESEHSASIHSIDLTLQSLPIERALGSFWDTESDSLQFNVKVPIYSNPPDRRSVLSIIASVYDPLRCIAPFVLSGKMILQQMCREDVTWNQSLPVHLIPRWKLWLHNLTQLSTVIIPRCFVIPQFGKVVRRELHHFSDARTMEYGQCTYLKQINEHGDICCSFVIGKARVTPLKMITIPRLEFTAALLSIKISKLLKPSFKYQINEEYF